MRKLWYIGFVVLAVTIITVMESRRERLTEGDTISHHTEKGFRNPFTGFQEHGFSDFLKWAVERKKGTKEKNKTEYSFETVDNDGSYLRENKDDISVTWVGHSTLLVQLKEVNILTDPMWGSRASPVAWAGPERLVKPVIAFENLPEIHVVLISHDHYDHLDKGTLKRLGSKPFYVVPLGIGKYLKKLRIDNYRELDWWDTVTYGGIEFACTPAQHFSGRWMFDRNKTLWCGWAVRGKSASFYFAGDSGYFSGFREIGKRFGPFDLVCLPIGAYLPQWFMGRVHTSPKEAIQAFHDLCGSLFLAIHWGTFVLADDPPDLAPEVLREEIRKAELNKKDFWILKHGETRGILHSVSLPGVE
ncbi:MBL fold metallo-hydrolase [Candidatus Latescibacterota bacterium]